MVGPAQGSAFGAFAAPLRAVAGDGGLAAPRDRIAAERASARAPGRPDGQGGTQSASPPAVLSGRPLAVVPPLQQVAAETRADARGGEPSGGEEPAADPEADAAAERPRPSATTEEETDASGLTEEEQAEVRRLQRRDREVRRHEEAHARAGGQYAGNPRYEFTTGPDGKQYAVSGSVSIDVSEVPNNPRATIRKMDQVLRAALAPADPSSQDRRVAATARQARAEAQVELRQEQAEEAERRAERAEARKAEADRPDDAERGSVEALVRAYARPERSDPRPDGSFDLTA